MENRLRISQEAISHAQQTFIRFLDVWLGFIALSLALSSTIYHVPVAAGSLAAGVANLSALVLTGPVLVACLQWGTLVCDPKTPIENLRFDGVRRATLFILTHRRNGFLALAVLCSLLPSDKVSETGLLFDGFLIPEASFSTWIAMSVFLEAQSIVVIRRLMLSSRSPTEIMRETRSANQKHWSLLQHFSATFSLALAGGMLMAFAIFSMLLPEPVIDRIGVLPWLLPVSAFFMLIVNALDVASEDAD